jgi:hypothetical protein
VQPSNDLDPTSSVPASPGPRRRWTRKKTLGAVLALTAVTGLAGLAQANMASAASLGTVMVDVNVADANNWGAGWGTAYDRCRSWHAATKSVRFDHTEFYYSSGNPNPVAAQQIWECLDTP